MRIVERDGKKYLVVQEKPKLVELEIVEELEGGEYKVRTKQGNIITFGPPRPAELTEEDIEAFEELEEAREEWENEHGLNERQEAILWFLFEKKEPIPLKELVNHFGPKFDVSKDTIRLDLEDMIKRHLVERPSRGLYKISKSGMSYLGATPPGLYYECVESALLKALELTNKVEDKQLSGDLYMTIVDALDCLRNLGRMYQKEWDIEVPLD